jgi:hypothetical protein
MPVTTKTINSKAVELQRPTSWDEAYLRYPRAYLYISTSVEYSLSFGRMPAESVFPEQVRHVPSLVFGSKLSPRIDTPCIRFSDSSNPYLGTDYSTNDPTLIFGLEPVPGANRNMKALMDKEASPSPERNHHVDESGSSQHAESYDSDSTRDSRKSNIQPMMMQDETPRVINLDYFDIDPIYAGN